MSDNILETISTEISIFNTVRSILFNNKKLLYCSPQRDQTPLKKQILPCISFKNALFDRNKTKLTKVILFFFLYSNNHQLWFVQNKTLILRV